MYIPAHPSLERLCIAGGIFLAIKLIGYPLLSRFVANRIQARPTGTLALGLWRFVAGLALTSIGGGVWFSLLNLGMANDAVFALWVSFCVGVFPVAGWLMVTRILLKEPTPWHSRKALLAATAGSYGLNAIAAAAFLLSLSEH